MNKSNQSSLDIADHLSRGEYDWCPEAETRLREQHDLIRQQQTEIEALKLQLHTTLTNRDLRTYDGKTEVNNKPVAWMLVDASWNDFCRYSSYPSDGAIPLYTHPAELTDEEIRHIQAICHLKDVGYDGFIMRFARAILRKAQE